MSKKLQVSIISAVSFAPPFFAFAQTTPLGTTLASLNSTLNTIIGILFVIATIVFLCGVIQFIASSGDEAKRAKAKGIMTWGIIGLAVMAAAWGIVNVLVTYFGVQGVNAPPSIPKIPFQQ